MTGRKKEAFAGYKGTETYSDLLIFGTCGQVLAIRAEADAADIQIAVLVDVLILKCRHILASSDVENLSRTVATSGQVLAVTTETNAANHAIVGEVVHDRVLARSAFAGTSMYLPVSDVTSMVVADNLEQLIRSASSRSSAEKKK